MKKKKRYKGMDKSNVKVTVFGQTNKYKADPEIQKKAEELGKRKPIDAKAEDSLNTPVGDELTPDSSHEGKKLQNAKESDFKKKKRKK